MVASAYPCHDSASWSDFDFCTRVSTRTIHLHGLLMKIFAVLAALILFVLACDKYEDKLFPPISWIYAVWKKFSHILGIVMSFIILTILWIVGFGIYALILKVITLPKRFAKEPNTFWIDVEPTTNESMAHQF